MSVREPDAQILTESALLAKYGRPRSLKLVFTNGVFDLLHRGHVEYLYAARSLGDALVIGVNTDASVRRIKGESRPLTNQDDRAYILAALECVDGVTLFDEDTPLRIIAKLLPDILVKGADYRLEEVVGRAEVEAAGGQVKLLPLVHGRSTTGLVTRIRDTT